MKKNVSHRDSGLAGIVTQQFLKPQICPAFQQMGSVRMPQPMQGDWLCNLCFFQGLF